MKEFKKYTKQDQLQNLLDKRTRGLTEEAIQSEGDISESKLAGLKRISQLIDIRKTAGRSRARWPVIIVLTLTLIIVSILLFARVSSTEIELDLSLSEVSFGLPKLQVLTNEIKLSALGVSGISEIQFPRSENREAQVIQTSDKGGLALNLTPIPDIQQNGSVTLSSITVTSRSQIDISLSEIPQQYRLSFKDSDLDLRAAVHGLIEIGQPGAPPEQVNFLSPKSVLFQSSSGQTHLDPTFLKNNKNIFHRQLLVDRLSLFQIDEQASADNTIIRRISTVLSGTLYYESLGGKEQQLRSGQEVRFETSLGEIRSLELHDGHISFAFHGTVRGMTTGSDKNRVSLMPTYLEWLSAHHGLSMIWGTTLYFFGLIFGIIRWWRAPA